MRVSLDKLLLDIIFDIYFILRGAYENRLWLMIVASVLLLINTFILVQTKKGELYE